MRILLAGDPPSEVLRERLERAELTVLTSPLSGIHFEDVRASQLVILDVPAASVANVQGVCRRWRIELGEHFLPIIWLGPPGNLGFFAAGLDSGADVCLDRTVDPDYLLSQIKALCRVQGLNQRLQSRSSEVTQLNQRLQEAYQQIDSDLELTRRIHRGFLPRSLPELGSMRFAVCYRPRSRIGGDFYDSFRLDEDHIVIYTADAMGRGLPASSLLSIFVKKSIQAKEISGKSYRLIPPSEVLTKLNRELVALNLPEPPFVSMLFAQVNCKRGDVTFSRAAHPHPLYVPVEGNPQYVHAMGTLLGVFEAEFPEATQHLNPGDKLILFSDGVHPPDGAGPGSADDPLIEAAQKYRDLPAATFVDQVARELLEQSKHQEDFTLLVMEHVAG